MKIFISAAETSSDLHGAELLAALKEQDPQLEAYGVGGPKLEEAGLRSMVDARQLLAMGFTEALPRLPSIIRSFRKVVKWAEAERPDVAVVIDYPEFHFRLARRFNELGIPVVYYIPPKVWVWRKGRVRTLRRRFAKVLSVLPFENQFYLERGMPVDYVGNSLTESLPLRMSKEEARQKLEIDPQERVVCLMVGSRPSEVSHHFDLALDGCVKALEGEGATRVLLPFPQTFDRSVAEKYLDEWKGRRSPSSDFRFDVSIGRSHECMVAADAGLVKSGTSTLEAGLLGLRQSVYFKPSALTYWIFKNLIRYRGAVGLVNLAAGLRPGDPGFVTEWIGPAATVENLAAELRGLLFDSDLQASRDRTNQQVLEKMKPPAALGETPAAAAARAVLSTRPDIPIESSRARRTLHRLGSWVWSSLNRVIRRLYRSGLLRSVRLPSRVISVGNLQAGGSGKTPIVAALAREAIAMGQTVCILSRGYGSKVTQTLVRPGDEEVDPRHVGDEVALIHDLVPGAWIGVGSDRRKSFAEVQSALGRSPDLVILDDGFQHFRIKRDFDVLAVTSWTRSDGFFRDFDSEIPESAYVFWTKGARRPLLLDRVAKDRQSDLSFELNETDLRDRPVWLVSGLGMNEAFESSVRRTGATVLGTSFFPDHHFPTPKDREEVDSAIRNRSKHASVLRVMTKKDYVKWKSLLTQAESEWISVEPTVRLGAGVSWKEILTR